MERSVGPRFKSLTSEMRRLMNENQLVPDTPKPDRKRLWRTYGSNIDDYESRFSDVMKPDSILNFVRKRTPPVMVVDLMSPTHALASLFQKLPDIPRLGVSVSLEDWRETEEELRDENLNIHHIKGDVLKPSTWTSIEERLEGQKADLIIEHAIKGLEFIPFNERLYYILLNKAWHILKPDGGVLLVRAPYVIDSLQDYNHIHAVDWIDLLNKNQVTATWHVISLKIVRNPDSPTDLPKLH